MGDAVVVDVHIDDRLIRVLLRDGRELSAPLARFPRLLSATAADRQDWRVLGDGEGIHWPAIDEDISVAGLLRAS
ncbi:MAG TPA: DUF2442 domain-containing protein [Protaetiibacter sp.]|nr:DUF2442 domain-containing protein [Protaetiibacter sp.]